MKRRETISRRFSKRSENNDGHRHSRRTRLLSRTLTTSGGNAGKYGEIIALDPVSGDCEIDADALLAGLRLKQRRPDAALWAERIGFDAVSFFGPATLHRKEK